MSFFNEKKAAAVLKHAILKRYLRPFSMKVGKYSDGHRVAFVDGYAGEGQYASGDEGSPAIAIAVAKQLAGTRSLECSLVEEDAEAFEKLEAFVESEREDIAVELYHGDIGAHLPTILQKLLGVPMFVFLDPFGLMRPYEEVVQIFERPSGYGAPAAEVLINFNAGALRRIAGHLTSEKRNESTLSRMDEVCGGDWWRQTWVDNLPDLNKAEDAVVNGYTTAIARKTATGVWCTDVRNRPDLKPVYHLMFITRHRDGMHLFGEILSSAIEEWRKVVAESSYSGTLIDPEEVFGANEKTLAEEWDQELYANLKNLLEAKGAFTVSGKYSQVFGKALGLAREKPLRKAWARLYRDGITKTDSKGDLLTKRIEPA